jgi:hypothetical protein
MATVEDQAKGRAALAELRRPAEGAQVAGTDDDPSAVAARRKRAELERAAREMAAAREVAVARKASLRDRFRAMSITEGTKAIQDRGYAFEEFLRDLFVSEDLAYRLPYRVGTVEQIDSDAFCLNGHEYLLEAKWQRLAPSLSDLLVLAEALATKYTDTRGSVTTFIALRAKWSSSSRKLASPCWSWMASISCSSSSARWTARSAGAEAPRGEPRGLGRLPLSTITAA